MLNQSDRPRSQPRSSQLNATLDIASASSAGDHGAHGGHGRRSDPEARARASEFLHTLAGAQPAELSWDDTFRLQGHAHVGRRELIVIAPRDDQHETLVLMVEDWNQLHREGSNSAALIAERAIVSPQHLESALAEQYA
jgi:hypothetical protein